MYGSPTHQGALNKAFKLFLHDFKCIIGHSWACMESLMTGLNSND